MKKTQKKAPPKTNQPAIALRLTTLLLIGDRPSSTLKEKGGVKTRHKVGQSSEKS